MTITLAPIHDLELIRKTITHPRIYRHVSDDFSPEQEHFIPCEHPSLLYLGAYAGDEYLGLWMFCPSNSICWDVHTCLLPKAWGRAVEAATLAMEYVWKNTPCRRIITSVPKFNGLALRLAENVGMTRYGVNHRSFLKNGELHDQILLGISKSESQ